MDELPPPFVTGINAKGRLIVLAAGADRWLIGLPGDPLAAIAGLFTVGQPVVAGLLGQRLHPLDTAEITASVKGAGCATRLIPCSWMHGRLTPTAHAGSGMLRGLAAADALAVVGPTGCSAGDEVPLLALR